MTEAQVQIGSEQEMEDFGRRLASGLLPGSVVYLCGDLGAGKTTLTRGIARGLGHTSAVKSPTYTLVEPYAGLSPALYHFDLYRLGDPEELEFMGIRDYFDSTAVIVVEWPERGFPFLPAPDLEISIDVAGDGRSLRISARGEVGAGALHALGLHPER